MWKRQSSSIVLDHRTSIGLHPKPDLAAIFLRILSICLWKRLPCRRAHHDLLVGCEFECVLTLEEYLHPQGHVAFILLPILRRDYRALGERRLLLQWDLAGVGE